MYKVATCSNFDLDSNFYERTYTQERHSFSLSIKNEYKEIS